MAEQRATRGGRDAPLALAAIVAAGCVGEIAPMVMPLLLDGVVARFGVGHGAAGMFPALEIAGIAAGALALSARPRALDPAVVLRLAVLLVATAGAVSLVTDSFAVFLGARVVTGTGEGLLMAAANILASRTRAPHRVYSLLLTAVTGVFVSPAIGIPDVGAAFSPRAGPGVLLAVTGAAAPLLLAFRPRPATDGDGRRPAWLTAPGRRVLAAGVLVYLGFSALWTYSGRIGAAAGLSLAEIGIVVTGCAMLGIVGPLTAGAVSLRWRRTPPVVTSLALVVTASIALAVASSRAGVALSLVIVMPAFMAFVTYLRSALAALDASGRLVGLGVGLLTAGAAAGPMLLGALLGAGGSYDSVAWIAVTCGVAAAALLVPVTRALDAERGHIRGRVRVSPSASWPPAGRDT